MVWSSSPLCLKTISCLKTSRGTAQSSRLALEGSLGGFSMTVPSSCCTAKFVKSKVLSGSYEDAKSPPVCSSGIEKCEEELGLALELETENSDDDDDEEDVEVDPSLEARGLGRRSFRISVGAEEDDEEEVFVSCSGVGGGAGRTSSA